MFNLRSVYLTVQPVTIVPRPKAQICALPLIYLFQIRIPIQFVVIIRNIICDICDDDDLTEPWDMITGILSFLRLIQFHILKAIQIFTSQGKGK